jgi:molybdopterin-guanine dinucleotide biosynthesis protein B
VKNQIKHPIISFVGSSGSGKTTLLERLIPELTRLGFKVGTIKHDVHGFEMDKPGKDSWRHKQAGAAVSMISSPVQIGMVMDVDHDHHPDELSSLLSGVDIILTEGYKRKGRAKVEIFRPNGRGEKPLCMNDEYLIALVTDTNIDLDVPRFSLNDIKGLADFLITHLGLKPEPTVLT